MKPITKTLREFIELSNAATPGPWFAGAWSGRCHENHAHSRGVCNYQYSKCLKGESAKCVSVDGPDPIELIGWDDYGTVLKKESTAAFIAQSRTLAPKLAEALMVAVEAIHQEIGDTQDAITDENLRTAFSRIEKIMAGES